MKRTVASVLMQEWSEFEYIIVDGASTDGSVEFLKEISNKNLRYISEADNGIYSALNKGVKMANGEYILFVNSGDVLSDPNVLNNFVNYIHKFKNLSGYFGIKSYANFDISTNRPRLTRIWKPGLHKRWKYLFGWMVPHQALLVKRNLFHKYGGFDEQFNIAADYDWLLRVFYVNRESIKYCSFNVITMENGGVSNSSLSNVSKANSEVIKSWRKYFKVAPYWIFILKPCSKLFQLNFKQWFTRGR